ncbi:MAG: ATP-binding protein, partial [Phycisphaerae bacterium]|nr:ATP-binding protein [Phycisphaerae bacterium]
MHLHQVTVKNFRLLADVELILEKETTLIVGRNNSGKTSLSEVIRRFLVDSAPSFQVEDFASACYDAFCDALTAKNEGKAEDVIRAMLPAIELRLTFKYDPSLANFGPLGEFVIDLDPACDTALVVAEYALRDGSIKAFFDGQPTEPLTEHTRTTFLVHLQSPGLNKTNGSPALSWCCVTTSSTQEAADGDFAAYRGSRRMG